MNVNYKKENKLASIEKRNKLFKNRPSYWYIVAYIFMSFKLVIL